MKKFVIVILSLLFADTVFCQNQSSDSAKAIGNTAVRPYTWEIQKVAQGTLLLLDVPYKRDGKDSAEDLTITVAKDRMHKRPASISIIVPSNVEQTSGIFLRFSKIYKDTSGKGHIEMERADPLRLQFERCNDEQKICTARIQSGYIVDAESEEKHDVFREFMELDYVYLLLIYPDGSHKSVEVPLASFKEQYQSIVDSDSPERHQ